MTSEMGDVDVIPYEISAYSSYSTTYIPDKIRENTPTDPGSRWSSNTNSPPQFITLRMQRPAIVKYIKFGKYEKTHVCNLRKFRIFGGLDEDHLVMLFEGGLKNDSVPETFQLRHRVRQHNCESEGALLPIKYLKIVPLLSWGTSFNFSIWYVELLGVDKPSVVQSSLRSYNKRREVETVRLCLKHFRQSGYTQAFQALQQETNIQLEDENMTELHEMLVSNGEFQLVEEFMESCVKQGLLDSYLKELDYKATWQLLHSDPMPGMRGGHQMAIDCINGRIYLFGGWNGFEDVSDLWVFEIAQCKWRLIHENAEKFGGPSPRSCHKMIFEPRSQQIFILGRYLDSMSRTKEHIQSEFFLFDTISESWLLICDDTAQMNGPRLLFDHQMCLDAEKRTIYVFGGRIVTPRNIEELSNTPQYSGLYSFDIPTNTWTSLLVDCDDPTATLPGNLIKFDAEVGSIKSRVTHSMLFHNQTRCLYIFGGQRNKDYTTDFIEYNVDEHKLRVINSESTSSTFPSTGSGCEQALKPQCGFTQRATIDCRRDEIYVLSSLSKEKERRDLNINSFWMYSLKTNQWKCVYTSAIDVVPTTKLSGPSAKTGSEPCPRYAHQLVYDDINQVHYLFGGNPGRHASPQLRLDDFWMLRLEKPTRNQILRHCKYQIRKLEYEEIARKDPVCALNYLQSKLNEIIDHDDANQLREFHKLAALLFKPVDPSPTSSSSICPNTMCVDGNSTSDDGNVLESEVKSQRSLLFNKLVEMISTHILSQPKENLSDFIVI